MTLFRIISAEKARFPVSLMCEVLDVNRSGFYAWETRAPSDRALSDAWLTEQIREIWAENRKVYGARRVHAELRLGRGVNVSRKRVERLMREAGISGLIGRRRRGTTIRVPGVRVADDLVQRGFRPAAPNVLWCADITYLETWQGRCYLAAVQDLFSRTIVGWQLAEHMRAELVVEALQMAVARRRPQAGLVHHSDQGSQGGFKWSSQRLDEARLRWARRSRRGRRRGGRGCGRPGRPPVGRVDHRRRCWQAIARGDSTLEAAAFAGVSGPVGVRWFREGGGMPTVSLPAPSARFLCFAEREDIAVLRAEGKGVREIARELGRSPSTLSRELRRNAATRGGKLDYRASVAQWHAEQRAKRPKAAKLAVDDRLREYVAERLAGQVRRPDGRPVTGPVTRAWNGRNRPRRADRRWASAWSPEQISGRLAVDFPDDPHMRVSHEAIYQALFVQGRGALRRELSACLRTGRALRVPRARVGHRGKGFITEEVMISQRPAEAADRAVPGHWEGDLILGIGRTAIGTLVERTSRFTMLLHLPPAADRVIPKVKNGPPVTGHGAEQVRGAIAAAVAELPEHLLRSLTWDQGAELAQHARLRIDTGLAVFFCDPQSPWQRGTNENTNGLLRQYFPRGTNLARHSPDDLTAVAHALNSRPRKTLGWRTPAEVLDEHLAAAT